MIGARLITRKLADFSKFGKNKQIFVRHSFSWSGNANKKTFGKIIGFATGGLVAVVYGLKETVWTETKDEQRKKIVVLGSGWGAVSFLRSLKPGQYDVSVVSPDNYFVFTPLLPGVTVGTVEGRSVVEPIRKIITRKHKSGVKFYEAECIQVDVENNKITCADCSEIKGKQQEFSMDYDYLVMGVGAQTASYNIPGVQEYTHYLKNVQQAQAIRKNIMDSFETANMPGQPDHEVRRLLHFVVVGGGPTGVEFAAELRDFVKKDLMKFYPSELIEQSQITLVDGLNKILNTYSDEISRYAEGQFKKEGIDIVTNTFVNKVEDNLIHLKDAKSKEIRTMPYGMCVWCAGIAPRPITKQVMKDIPEQTNRFGLITNSYLKVKNAPNIYALGDCSTIQYEKLTDCIDVLYEETGVLIDQGLTKDQFENILHLGMKKLPHLCHHFRELESLFSQVDEDKDDRISHEEFLKFAAEADSRQTALPPTAQVAAQEGKYLGKMFSAHAMELDSLKMEGVKPFHYNHLGSFAYVGDNRAVLELPVIGALRGWSTMWLWRGAYASEAVSFRMRVLIVFDWMKSFCFGRDTSRI